MVYNRRLFWPVLPARAQAAPLSRMRVRTCTLLALLLLAIAVPSFALHNATAPPVHKKNSVRHHGRRLRWNPMFRPSRESLLKQNDEINRLELPRIQDEDELEALKASAALVPIRESDSLRIDRRLDRFGDQEK